MHFRRTELPTGRAMTRFLIFAGWVKRGRTTSGKMSEKEIGTVIRYKSIIIKYVLLLLAACRTLDLNVKLQFQLQMLI